jgi:hypothetical protein
VVDVVVLYEGGAEAGALRRQLEALDGEGEVVVEWIVDNEPGVDFMIFNVTILCDFD